MNGESGGLATGCLICGAELAYRARSVPAVCVLCKRTEQTIVQCLEESCPFFGGGQDEPQAQ